ncbi:hypothetical protein C5167_016938 [Papaver somniferum]|uniref:Uncharacterized protein n=1 Tax=Papaver somniferum TaxID=3469 RepID=A0A4Y7IHZ3_PAPSO|nr:hypothetical protein C5167_016938 [Papaver somniferum]
MMDDNGSTRCRAAQTTDSRVKLSESFFSNIDQSKLARIKMPRKYGRSLILIKIWSGEDAADE